MSVLGKRESEEEHPGRGYNEQTKRTFGPLPRSAAVCEAS